MRIVLELCDRQDARMKAWFKHHREIIHKGFMHSSIDGAAIKFSVIPTGLGPNVEAECLWCKEGDPAHSVVLTIDDYGEFLYQYDVEWNKIPASWETS